MADDGGVEGAVAFDSVAAHRPIAAVPLRKQIGDLTQDTLAVVCDDGSVFKRVDDGHWLELGPVPGTARALALSSGAMPQPDGHP